MVSAVQASRECLLLEERAERFQTGTIDSGQKATQTGPMGKISAPKQRHESRLEGSQAFKEICQRPFPADGIADQQREKIDGFIAAETTSHQADPARAKASSSPLVAK